MSACAPWRGDGEGDQGLAAGGDQTLVGGKATATRPAFEVSFHRGPSLQQATGGGAAGEVHSLGQLMAAIMRAVAEHDPCCRRVALGLASAWVPEVDGAGDSGSSMASSYNASSFVCLPL